MELYEFPFPDGARFVKADPPVTGELDGVALLSNGMRLLWNDKTAKYTGEHAHMEEFIGWVENGKYFTATESGVFCWWEWDSNKVVSNCYQTFDAGSALREKGFQKVEAVKSLPKAKMILFKVRGRRASIYGIDCSGPKPPSSCFEFVGCKDDIAHFVAHSANNILIATDAKNKLIFWDIMTQEIISSISFNIGATKLPTISLALGSVFHNGEEEFSVVVAVASSAETKMQFFEIPSTHSRNKSRDSHSAAVQSVNLSDSGIIATGGDDNTVRLWNSESGHQVACLQGHTDKVLSVEFSTSGGLLISASWDRSLRLWMADSGKEVSLYADAHDSSLTCCACHDKKGGADVIGIVVSGDWEGVLKVWNVTKDKELKQSSTELGRHQGILEDVAFTTCGNWIISSGKSDSIKLWSVSDSSHFDLVRENKEDDKGFTKVGVHNDRICAGGMENGIVSVWRVDFSKRSSTIVVRVHAHDDKVTACRFSEDGRFIVSSGVDGRCVLLNARGDFLFESVFSSSPILDLWWNPDSIHFYVGTKDCCVVACQVETSSEELLVDKVDKMFVSWIGGMGSLSMRNTQGLHDNSSLEIDNYQLTSGLIEETPAIQVQVIKSDPNYERSMVFEGVVAVDSEE
eukprot:TRINITY_DN7504_c0_g1_i1.p1 TRINITY_DN7504_c0_g1~~TRINITY_DN7504_c0_g1_i1.p1  ORF type:complete len:630 (+),score=142.89 TRINITY_DN7504_c0_g1_i1:1-1890(+)